MGAKLSVALLLLAATLAPIPALSHPLKLSSSRVQYDPDTGTLGLEARVFVDDFEGSMSRSVLKGGEMAKLSEKERNRFIEAYFEAYYHIVYNGKQLPMKFESSRILKDANVLIIVFAGAALAIKAGDTLEIRNKLFFQDFGPLQTNRIMIRVPPFGISERHAATINNHTYSFKFGEKSP